MGIFNNLFKKSAKTSLKQEQRQKDKQKRKESLKKELTLAELKEAKDEKTGERKEAKKTIKEIVKKEDTQDAYKVLIKPLVTEKGTYLGAQNKYLFEVSPWANKIEIKKAIKSVYGVLPLKVNIINLSGKKVRYGRTRGQTKDSKKALVTLKEGETIQAYEGV